MSNITIYIDWIRHGFSCANAIKVIGGEAGLKGVIKNLQKGTIQDSRAIYAPDSKLSNFGVKQSVDVNDVFKNRINQYDMMFCSELTRAAETAIIICKNTLIETIFMIPYISEERLKISMLMDKDNQASDPVSIKKKLEAEYPNINGYPTLNVEYVQKIKKIYDDNNNHTIPNLDLFNQIVLPNILSNLKDKYPEKIDFHIGIVSHHHFIKNIFKKYHPDVVIDSIKNTQIISEKIIFHNNDIKFRTSVPKCTCGYQKHEELYTNLQKECSLCKKCQIPFLLQKKNELTKSNIKYYDVEKCVDITTSKGQELEKLLKSKIKNGGYYEKYIKYKTKYLTYRKSTMGI